MPDAISKLSDAILEKLYPFIEWREPIKIRSLSRGLERLGCRLCIAKEGIKESEIHTLFKTLHEFNAHLLACHPVTDVTNKS